MKLLVGYTDEMFRQLKRTGRKHRMIIYKREGVALARAFPTRVKRSRKTTDASHIFGWAASRGKTLRQLLIPLFHFPKKRMHVHFATRLKESFETNDHHIRSIKVSRLKHFSFNDIAEIRRHWRIELSCKQHENQIEIRIPSFVPRHSFKAPARTTSIECIFAAACIRMFDGIAIGHHHMSVTLPYDNFPCLAQVVSLPMPMEEGCLVIVGASLTYILSNNKKEMRPEFLPSSVIDAWYN